MIQDFRLAREPLCMTNAGTDLAVQIPDVSLDLKILLAIQNRLKDKHEIFWTTNFDAAT